MIILSFSGSAGSGKTTLAKEYSKLFKYTYRPEGVEDVFDKYKLKPPEIMKNITEAQKRSLKAAQEEILNRFIESDRILAKSGNNSVCDRSPVDCMAYYLYWCNDITSKKDFEVYKEAAFNASKLYTIHFVFPVMEEIDSNYRSTNYVYQQVIHNLILGILSDWGLLYKNIESKDIKGRIYEIHNSLQILRIFER